jgi:actin-related protein 5
MKSNVDARARAKEEKEREKARREEVERLDREQRENNFETWVSQRRNNRQVNI